MSQSPSVRALIPIALVVMNLVLAWPGLVLASDLEPTSAAPDVVITIDASGVHPREATVTAGDVVQWRNADSERHRMRARSGPAQFDTGNLESGERYAIRVTATGTYPYIDERDEDASAFHGRIVVVASGATGESDGAGETPAKPADPSTSATVTLGDDFVDPAVVRLQAGGSVTFRNQGDDEHSATSTDGGPIDSGALAGGSDYRATFPNAGTFAFMCIFHSEMQGTVTVVASSAPAAAPAATPTPAPATASPEPTPPAASPEPDPVAADQVHVEIVDLEFRAPDVTVAAGGLVTWTNAGEAPHTVTESDGSFDSDILEPGAGFEQRFVEPGTYAYLCQLHPGMAGTVEVVAAGAAAEPEPAAIAVPGDGDPPGPSTDDVAATGALGDMAGLILAVAAVSIAVALFVKVIGGTVRPGSAYRPE